MIIQREAGAIGISLKDRSSTRRTAAMCVLLTLGTIFVLIGITSVFASLSVDLSLDGDELYHKADSYKISVSEMIGDFWPDIYPNDKEKPKSDLHWGRILVVLCVSFSVFWPFIKVSWLTSLWFRRFIDENSREKQLYFILCTGRWNLFELFLYNTLAISITLDHLEFKYNAFIHAFLDMRMTAKAPFAFFIGGQTLILIITELMYEVSLELLSIQENQKRLPQRNTQVKSLMNDVESNTSWISNVCLGLLTGVLVFFIPYVLFFMNAFSVTFIGYLPTYSKAQLGEVTYSMYSALVLATDRWINKEFGFIFILFDVTIEIFLPIIALIMFLTLWTVPMEDANFRQLARCTRIALSFSAMDVSTVCRWIVISKLNVFFSIMIEVTSPSTDKICDAFKIFGFHGECLNFEGDLHFGMVCHSICSFFLLVIGIYGLRHPAIIRRYCGDNFSKPLIMDGTAGTKVDNISAM